MTGFIRVSAFLACFIALICCKVLANDYWFNNITGNVLNQKTGDAIYIEGSNINAWNHAGIFYKDTDGSLMAIHVSGGNDGLISKIAFNDFKGNRRYYGAHYNPDMNKSSREAVLEKTAEFYARRATIHYTAFGQIDWDGSDWNGTIDDLENVRCDGMVEVSYELNDIPVWGKNQKNYLIQDYPSEHNDAPDVLSKPEPNTEVCPVVQRGGPGRKYTKLRASDASVNPTIAQLPMSGPPGTTFTQWGTGFTPNGTAILHFRKPDGSEYPTQNQQMDSTGHFEIKYTAPLTKPLGTYAWWGIDGPTRTKSNEVSYQITQKQPGSISVNPTSGSWTDTPHNIAVSCSKAERIYCTLRTTTDGSTPPDPPEPTIESHDPVDAGKDYISGTTGNFSFWGANSAVKKLKVRFRGYNSGGYGPTSQVYSYSINLKSSVQGYEFVWKVSREQGGFDKPIGIAVDTNGYVYVADTYNHRVLKFNSSGVFLGKWGSVGSGDGQFIWPYGVAVHTNGFFYVTDTENYRVQKFNSNGMFATKWGSQGTGNGQFYDQTGIAVHTNGYVYVADPLNNRIQKFDSDGNFITKWGSTRGSGDGEFAYPRGIAVDANGNVYVADTANDRIQKFDSNGIFITKWGSTGSSAGQLRLPDGIAVNTSEKIYVADSSNNRIQKFDSSGTFITKWGTKGDGDGQFNCPQGIAVDADGNVYVADTWNYRIQKFRPKK